MASPRTPSTPSSSKHPHIQRGDSPRPRPNKSLISQVFKPKFPLDPFVQLHTIREPWTLKLENVLTAASEVRANVVLVLGAPPLRDINPILQSPQLASSLIIIASHQPPTIPVSIRPAICILHLNKPLAIETNGAVRFVKVLEYAKRVGHIWRKNGGSGIREIRETETGLMADQIPSNFFHLLDTGSASPSPLSSSERLKNSIPSQQSSFISTFRSSVAKSRSRKQSTAPSADPSQRPLDVLLNFLPPGLKHDASLKQSILVTTLSHLVASSDQFTSKPSGSPSLDIRQKSVLHETPSLPPLATLGSRDSLQTNSTYNSSSTSAPLAKSRLLHILPQAGIEYVSQEKLIHGLESFQLSFSQPPSLDINQPEALDRAAAYIVPAAALREIVRYDPPRRPSTSSQIGSYSVAAEWTVTDIILSGVLDPLSNPGQVSHAGPRAWISGADDFAFAEPDMWRSDSLFPPNSPSPRVLPKVKRRPVPSMFPDILSPPSSSEDSAL
ncbi:hypothetical protein BU15DRAFT_46406 [Melanogaster broomeanus]|nr:hypothetical protein BU15DRAFT_46406 [Melanogaster broomeanus]